MLFLTRLATRRARALMSPPSSARADPRSDNNHNTSCWAPYNSKPHTLVRTRCTYITGHACRRLLSPVQHEHLQGRTTSCRPARQLQRRAGRCNRSRALVFGGAIKQGRRRGPRPHGKRHLRAVQDVHLGVGAHRACLASGRRRAYSLNEIVLASGATTRRQPCQAYGHIQIRSIQTDHVNTWV